MLLKYITEAAGVAGDEYEVRDVIREELKDYDLDIKTDILGNLIVSSKEELEGPKIMIAAHMDEIGMMIMSIDNSGLLKFRPVGGIDPKVLVAKTVVVGKEKLPGVIGSKAIHLQRPEERQVPLPMEALYIDIGAKNKEEAEKYVKVGDFAVFDTKYEEFGDGYAKAKAFDDRIGCAVLLEVLKEKYNIPVYGVFTVSEEIGLRGAGVAAYTVAPDIGIALEGTLAHDVTDMDDHLVSSKLRHGPVLTYIDLSVISDKKLVALAAQTAEANDIPYQYRNVMAGGNDSGKINQSRGGVPTIEIAVPTRYVHSPVSVIHLDDFANTVKLVKALIHSIESGGYEIK